MSNHSGSYLLNDVLKLLDERAVFAKLGRKETQKLVQEILRVADRYFCNQGEILDAIGEKLGICAYCGKARQPLVEGLCAECGAPGN